MGEPSIEFLTPERVLEMRDWLTPKLQEACDANEIARENLTPDDIIRAAIRGDGVMFLYSEDKVPACVLVIQLYTEGAKKVADVVALAGEKLTSFKRHYWQLILTWLRENNVEYLDAYVDKRRAKIYQSRFGFNKSCALVRMNLQGVCHE